MKSLYYGRDTRGVGNPKARLDEPAVREIILADDGSAQAAAGLSRKFGISKEHVRAISRGLRWKHIYKELKGEPDPSAAD